MCAGKVEDYGALVLRKRCEPCKEELTGADNEGEEGNSVEDIGHCGK